MFDKHADLKLIKLCKRGEEEAFAKLLSVYRNAIYGHCLRMVRNEDDAQDMAQGVFIKAFTMLDRYDESYAFSSWIFRIATNHCIDFLRRNRHRFMSLDSTLNRDGDEMTIDLPSKGPAPDTVLQRSESIQLLETVIDDLPPHYRAITLLRHHQDLTYEEIAVVLSLPLGTVKARIHRARAMVQKMVKERNLEF
jgi:RNA polymerase sigma factor (sigma-70 family)